MSEAEDLKRFVRDRLSAAVQEIVAAVDRAVSGYEAQAAGYRAEISRQQRHLEVLLQPRVNLSKTGESSGIAEEDGTSSDSSRQTSSRPRISRTHLDLKICLLKDSQTNVLSKKESNSCPTLELRCPFGLNVDGFKDFLRTSLSELKKHERPFDLFTCDERRRLRPVEPSFLTTSDAHCTTLYIRLQKQNEGGEPSPRVEKAKTSTGKSASPQTGTEDLDRTKDQNKEEPVESEKHQSDEERLESQVDLTNHHEQTKNQEKTQEKLPQTKLKKRLKLRCKSSVKNTFVCGVCGKSLCDVRSLSRHQMTHSAERPHGCEVCGRSFKLHGTLRQHQKIHSFRERSYLCDICCKMYLTSKQLQIHMRSHTNEKPFSCGECGKGFITKGTLAVHRAVHSGEAKYRCPECSCSFKRKFHLDQHRRLHSGLKPFVCGICGKACARKTYLTVHMRTHNGERPYKCSVCHKAFTQSHCLKTHMKSHQENETTLNAPS